MKYLFFILYLSLFSPVLIELPDFYRGQGVIFDKSYDVPILIKDNNERFTPTKEQIILSETIFSNDYNKAMSEDKRVINFKPVKNTKKEYWKYNRQYFGYITAAGDKIIHIRLMNFCKAKKAERNFENWQNEYILGFGKFYEKNSISFEVNLNSKKLILH